MNLLVGTIMKSGLLIAGLFFWVTFATAEEYPRSEFLIETDQLAKPEVAKQYVVLDCRSQMAYESGHVPEARWVDQAAWASQFANGADNAGWSKRIGLLGIKADSRVIVYDDGMAKDAARIWWILRYWGVKDTRLLNGGWTRWTSEKSPIEVTRVSSVTPAEFAAKADSRRLVTKNQILGLLNDKSFQIVDARSQNEFCGVDKLSNKRAGSIPGARHLEWIDLLDRQTQRFRSPHELRNLFEQSGINLDRPAIAHCQAGGRAAVLAFGMELMGGDNVSIYYAGWAEWGNADDTPVVVGVTKK